MNRKLENQIQELALAVINGNKERAERLIRQMPEQAIEKVAYGSFELLRFSMRFLPAGTSEQIRRHIEQKTESV